MASPTPPPEVWLRGPVPGVPTPLQPVAHALLQALEDAERLSAQVRPADLCKRAGGAASIGFHLRHTAGSLDRLLTYARGETLNAEQRAALVSEKVDAPDVDSSQLLGLFRETVERALAQLLSTPERELDEARSVGRAGHPSTVRGLLYHAGEHTTRHIGQISTTLRFLSGGS
jgi:uncharacterized damage-inducible protein DinB